MSEIRVKFALTEDQYRKYMKHLVLGNRKDVRRHVIVSVLIVLFGIANHIAGSPILGWIFILLGIYVFSSRFYRFFTSVNRIVSEFSLSNQPKYFYTLSFHNTGFQVQNLTEKAEYPYSRVNRVTVRQKEEIIYLFLAEKNAFLLPFDGFESGTWQDLCSLLEKKCPDCPIVSLT